MALQEFVAENISDADVARFEAAKMQLGGSHTAAGKEATAGQMMMADMASGSLATLAHDVYGPEYKLLSKLSKKRLLLKSF